MSGGSVFDPNDFEIFVMNADGSNRTRLTNNSIVDGQPSYSPDGTKILFAEDRDLRFDEETAFQITAFLKEHHVLSVVMTDRIIGCPHEEGIDYPDGEACPECPYWRGRDRFTGEMIQ